MTQEEKAKAYDEALKWMRELYPRFPGAFKEEIEHYFPELCESESEDERIRTSLYTFFQGMLEGNEDCYKVGGFVKFEGIDVKSILAWLEKQKEQKPAEKQDYSGLNDLEHLTEPKPAEWSKEDEGMLKWIEDILLIADGDLNDKLNGKVSPISDSAYSSMKLCIAKCLSWLKSLRPQPQGTYKLIVHNIYEMLKDKDFFDIPPSHRVSLLNDIRVRCKNADEQAEILDVPSWKPSEEQMNCLCAAVDAAIRKHNESVSGYQPARILKSLYEQLEKLM